MELWFGHLEYEKEIQFIILQLWDIRIPCGNLWDITILCGNQPPRWYQWSPPTSTHNALVTPFSTLYQSCLCDQVKWWYVTSDTVTSLLLSLSDSSHWGRLAAMSWRPSSSPKERTMWWGNEALCQQPCEWIIIEADAPSNQAFKWQQPWMTTWLKPQERSWTRTTQLSVSWITYYQKLYEIINVCCFKGLRFEITCYTAIAN